jgi:hypothetical protein
VESNSGFGRGEERGYFATDVFGFQVCERSERLRFGLCLWVVQQVEEKWANGFGVGASDLAECPCCVVARERLLTGGFEDWCEDCQSVFSIRDCELRFLSDALVRVRQERGQSGGIQSFEI